MAVLLLADVVDGKLATDQVAKALTAVKSLGPVTALVAGTGGDAAAAEAATLAGVSKVLFADDYAYCHGLSEPTAALVVSVLNILLSADRVRELFNLRMVNRMTRRRSFPVPGYPLIELPTGPVEEMLVGHGCGMVSFVALVRAMYLHGLAADEVNCADEDDDDEINDAMRKMTIMRR